MSAVAMAQEMHAGNVSVEHAITWHLTSNFMPPIRDEWIPICIGIVERYKAGDEDLSYKIHPPHKPEDVQLTAETIMNDLHLEPFLADDIEVEIEEYVPEPDPELN
jgi:hypothetical protein